MADNPIKKLKKKKGWQVTRLGFRTQEKSMGYIIFTYVHMCQSLSFSFSCILTYTFSSQKKKLTPFSIFNKNI